MSNLLVSLHLKKNSAISQYPCRVSDFVYVMEKLWPFLNPLSFIAVDPLLVIWRCNENDLMTKKKEDNI